jgi:hypothetical protein
MISPEHEETGMDTTSFENSAEDVVERIRPQIEDAKRRLARLNDQITDFITEHPAASLLGAVALGYLVAHVARSRS